MSANTNALAGIRCPKCGHEDSFHIWGDAEFLVTDDGVEETNDPTWRGSSLIMCAACSRAGTVSGFTSVPAGTETQMELYDV